MLSTFESALLERHLRRCADCRAFASAATEQTQLLRGAPLELPLEPVALPEARPSRTAARRSLAGVFVAAAAAATAAAALMTAGSRPTAPVAAPVTASSSLVVFAAQPTPTAAVEVPRLRLEPTSYLDGPVHGYYSIPA